MPGLAALLLATPFVGMQLQAPMLQSGAWFATSAGLSSSAQTALLADVVDVPATLPMPGLLQADDADEDAEEAAYAAAVRDRAQLGQIHRAMGIVTWASMTATVALGLIQYYNLYGLGAGQADNPCATGDAIFGQDQCWGIPWPHMISAAVTTTLYSATLAMSFGLLINDPNQVLTGRGNYSDKIRIHSVLALVHLAGMLAQTFIGVGLANQWFGDRTNNYEDMQNIAIVHQVVGWVTWGALGAAGAIMLF